MATILALTMKIAANTAGISKGAKDTAKQVSAIKKSAESASKAMKTLVSIEIGKVLAGMFMNASRSLINYANNLRDTIDRTAKLAAQTAISVETLQGFAVAASLGGTSLEVFSSNVKRLTVRVGRLAESGKTEIFTKLGIDFQNFQRLSPEEQFMQLSKAISGVADPAERARIAVELFGKAGAEMLPMLTTDFAALQERLEGLGVILSADQTSAIEQMNDAFVLVRATIDGIIGQVSANLAPVITGLAEDFLGFVEGYQGLGEGTGGTALADSITDALFDGAEYLAGILDGAVASFMEFGLTMETVAAVFDFTANLFVAVAETLKFAFNVFEMIGNALLMGLGKILETLGSWVSEDMEKAGKAMAEAGYDAFVKNGAEAGTAAANAFNAGVGERGYGREQSGGEGMFSGAVRAGRERYDSRNDPAKAAERERKRAEEQAARDAAQDAAARQDAEEKAREEYKKAQEKFEKEISDREKKLAAASLKYEEDRLDGLSAVNQKALKASDLRSGGIDAYIALATGREDPAVSEAKKQLKELQAMRLELQALKTAPVEIVGLA